MTKKQLLAFLLISSLSLSAHSEKQWSVFEDLLWWHASEQPTSIWAYQFELTGADQGTNFVEPNTYFGWSPGVRIGGQYKSNNYPDFKLYWTHYSTKTDESLKAPEGQFLLPQFFNGFSIVNFYNSAQMNWRIEMNILDAKVGHDFKPLDSLTIHPSVGIKGGTINQSIHSAWQLTEFDLLVYNATEDLKNNFSGLGPSIGLDGIWSIYKSFSIRSSLETALLWGHWTIKDNFNRPNSLLLSKKSIQSTANDSLGAFMASYFLGFEWSFQVKTLITLRAGYEMQFWSNQLRLPMFQALPIHGDLTLQGGTCGIHINI